MPASTDNLTVNKRAQIGVESTSGTAVAATKILEAISIEPGIKSDNKDHRAQGRKHPAVVTQGKESMQFKASGEADYQELVYPFSSIFGSATITIPGGGTNSRQWVFSPPLTGGTAVNTYTIEKGDSVRAYKFAYGLFTGVTLKYSRDSVDFSGDGIGQLITDNITLTPGLSPVGLNPILGNQMNFSVDTTSGGLGNTLISDVLEAEFSFTGAYGPYWPMVRANTSWARHVDMAPKCELKLTVQADSSGMSYLTNLRSGAQQFIRLSAVGPTALESTIFPTFNLDICGVVSGVQPFSDKDGVYAVQWTFTAVENATWGHAVQATMINLLSAL
jgi:hypothetical protein